MLLDIENLTVQLPGSARPLLAEVSLTVRTGEVVGLVGESGSGKSTTAKAAPRILPDEARATGRALVDGTDVLTMNGRRLREHRSRTVAMVHQDPRSALNAVRCVGDFLVERLLATGQSDKRAARLRAVGLLDAVGLPDPEQRIRQHPHEMSGGMLQRVAIARALAVAVDPRILVLDEAVAALDVSIQAQILQLLGEIRRDTGVALVFVSHDLAVVQHITDETVVMRCGVVVEQGPTARVLGDPQDPYTRLLLDSVPHEGWDPGGVRPLVA